MIKGLKLFITGLALTGLVFAGSGCILDKIFKTKVSVCETIPEGEVSLICIAAEKLGTTPETVGKVLKITDAALIYKHKLDALKVQQLVVNARLELEKIKEQPDIKVTMDEVVNYMNRHLQVLSPEAMILFEVIAPFEGVEFDVDVPLYLSTFDINMLISHLRDQEEMIEKFLLLEE